MPPSSSTIHAGCPRIWACPLAKIDKQFDNGPEDSVASFVEVIPTLDQHLANRPAE